MNNVPFLEYYLNFAKNHQSIKNIIEEDDAELTLHHKKITPLLETDYEILLDRTPKNV